MNCNAICISALFPVYISNLASHADWWKHFSVFLISKFFLSCTASARWTTSLVMPAASVNFILLMTWKTADSYLPFSVGPNFKNGVKNFWVLFANFAFLLQGRAMTVIASPFRLPKTSFFLFKNTEGRNPEWYLKVGNFQNLPRHRYSYENRQRECRYIR